MTFEFSYLIDLLYVCIISLVYPINFSRFYVKAYDDLEGLYVKIMSLELSPQGTYKHPKI